jgi:integrase
MGLYLGLMNKITFRLKNPSADKYTAIELRYMCVDGRLEYATGETIHPKDWRQDAQATDKKGIQAQLNRIEKYVNEIVEQAKIDGTHITKAYMKHGLDSRLRPGKQETFFALATAVIDRMEHGELLTPGKKRYAAGSIKTFRFTADFLNTFRPSMLPASVTLNTYREFISWCQKENYSINYIGSQIKNWKVLGRLIDNNPVYKNPEFKKVQEDATDIYLDEKEIKAIIDLKLDDKMLDTIRDWFVIDCYTGLRISDLQVLGKQNYANGMITISNKKTGEKVVVPVHPAVKKIRTKHNGFPPPVTDFQINRYIKSIARSAKIDKDVLTSITKGGVQVNEYKKKHDLVTCHTARRSFITNLLKSGVSETLVMKLTGIKAYQTMKRYNKMTADEAAEVMKGHEFFK